MNQKKPKNGINFLIRRSISVLLFFSIHSIFSGSFEQETSSVIRSQTTDHRPLESIDGISKITKDWSYYGEEEIKRFLLEQEVKAKGQNIFHFRQAKMAIINGDLELAYFFLSKINAKRTQLNLLKKRYLSIIKFIEGNYQESLNLISSNDFNIKNYYKEICLLRVINLMALDRMKEFSSEMGSCQNATFDYSNDDHFWLRQVTNIKDKNEALLRGNLISQLRETVTNYDFIKIWMKLALFINKEQHIIERVPKLSPSAYKDKEIRELIGFAYYRLGNTKKAEEFIEDIETPNADNIRGNINLANNKLELAFGHFKLALQKKQNSRNALERGIPLAYLLGQWDDGLSMLKKSVENTDEIKKMGLEAALVIRKNDIKRARELINILEYQFNNKLPYEITLMETFVSLKEGNQERLIESAATGCDKDEALHCWLNLKALEWENIGKTLTRDEVTLTQEFDLNALKNPQDIEPLKDQVFIDQKDIEELDGSDFKLRY